MSEKATVRIHESDKDRLSEIADATGQHIADVIAEFVREPAYVCPECGDPFDPAEVDAETVEEHGLLASDVHVLVKGQRDVKSFECPSCEGRLSPDDIEAVEADWTGGVTGQELGVTSEKDDSEEPAEGA